MKHYMDIENLRENDEEIGELIRKSNTSAFDVGDLIQITEKYDGSNASIRKVDGIIQAFSRKQPVTFNNTLNGFYDFVQDKIREGLDIPDGMVIFGEWSGARNKIVYEKKNLWLVFDIYDEKSQTYMPQELVKQFCAEHHLDYINELYNGPFVSWEHCRSFCHSPAYGNTQVGVVVKNQDKLTESNGYFYLKIVNKEFKETLRKIPKETDSQKEAEFSKAQELIKSIVTVNRVEKMLFKLRDEGIIGAELTPNDIGTLAKHLPKRIYEDCLKEEPETIISAGENAGRVCSSVTMQIVRSIILEN